MAHSKKIGKGNLIKGLFVLSAHDIFLAHPSQSCKSLEYSLNSCNSVSLGNNATVWHSKFRPIS